MSRERAQEKCETQEKRGKEDKRGAGGWQEATEEGTGKGRKHTTVVHSFIKVVSQSEKKKKENGEKSTLL